VQQGNFDVAIELLKDGREKALLGKDDHVLANVLKNSAYAYIELKDYSNASKMIKEGLEISINRSFLKNQIEFISHDVRLLEETGEYSQCVQRQKVLLELKDSLLSKEKEEAIGHQEILFETNRNKHRIETQKQELDINQIKLQRHKVLLFAGVLGFLFFAIVVVFFVWRNKIRNHNKQILLENKMLRSQMNPHFMFNALGAIHAYMIDHSSDESMIYLLDFSRLMRNILDSSRAEEISMLKDILMLRDYMKLQNLRFDNSFDYKINVDDSIDEENTFIPPMLLQPFIENAVEHGVRKLDKNIRGEILINIIQNDEQLILNVSDNGPGFAKRKDEKQNKNHVSHAIDMTRERIKTINHIHKFSVNFNVDTNLNNGTFVEIKIKQNNL
jgi:tetratricopeptide (TPR) repeat protein